MVNFIVIRIIPSIAAIIFTEACRYTCNQLFALRSSWPLHTGVRDVIRTLGCARQFRRVCRAAAGKRARDRRPSNVNNNIALSSADRSTFAIPTVSTRCYGSGYGSVIGSGQLYHGRREGRTTVRRAIQLNSQPVSSLSTTLGLLNARSIGNKAHPFTTPSSPTVFICSQL